MGLMFSYPIIGRFRFFSLTLVRAFLFSGWSQLLFSEVGIGEPSTEGCSGSILLSFMILGHPFAFQKHFIQFKRFLARRLAPVGFRCKPLLTSLTVLKQMRDIKRKRIFQVYFWQHLVRTWNNKKGLIVLTSVIICLPPTPIIFTFTTNCLTVLGNWLCHEMQIFNSYANTSRYYIDHAKYLRRDIYMDSRLVLRLVY